MMVLNKLAFTTMRLHKYKEAENFYKIACELAPQTSENKIVHFEAMKNLATFYLDTNLEKAE